MRSAYRIRLSLALLPLWAAVAATAQDDGREPHLQVVLKPRHAEVGDRLQAVIELTVPEEVAIGPPLFPDWGETWGEAEILGVGASETLPVENGLAGYRQTLTVTLWRTGEVTLPPVTVELPTASEILRIESEGPIGVTIDSVLPEGEELPPPKPPAPPRPLQVGERFWWTLALAGTACLLAAAILVRRRLDRLAASGAGIDPRTALREALERLEGSDDLEAVIAAVSLELRRYLGRSLGFPAAESTTSEIRRRLQEIALPAVAVKRIDTLLRRCDTIKFARGAVERETCAAAVAESDAVADLVEAHLAPPPAETMEERAA